MAYFVHANVITNANCGGSYSAMAGSGVLQTSAKASRLVEVPEPLVAKADGSGSVVPLKLYPPGFDLSDFLIFDPLTSFWAKGNEASSTLVALSSESGTLDGPPEPGEGGSGGTNFPPETGFYRVVRVGPHMIGVSNGMTLSGAWQIPVEVGYTDGELVNLTLTENGSPVGEASIHQSPFELPVPLVTLDTSRMSNGVHNISAIARWQIAAGANEESGGSFEADCPSISIVVSNDIFFPEWMPHFGQLDNSLLIKAQTVHTTSDWYIDVYDSQYSYIGTFGGQTTDGTIEAAWNLIGPFGEPHTNDSFFVFAVTVEFGPSGNRSAVSAVPPKTYKQTDPWPSPGGWVIVAQHAFDNINDCESLYAEIDGFVGMAQQYYVVRPAPVSGTAFPIRFQTSSADQDWAAFKQAVFHPLSRNLVYFGHGGPTGLGFALGVTNRSLMASEIANGLHTIPSGHTNRHTYRMVILDGCSTAAGTMPESFGIIHRENVNPMDYYYASERKSAFGGWSATKYVGFMNGASPNYGHIHFIQWIQYYLALGEGIKQAKDHAAGMPDVTWVTTSEFKLFGAWDLTFWGHND